MNTKDMYSRIREWLRDFIANSERIRDDLHVDEISTAFHDSSTWSEAGLQCFQAAADIARSESWPVTVSMEFFLERTAQPEGLPSDRVQDLRQSWTPPALTVFRRGAEPWGQNANYAPVHVEVGLPTAVGVKALFQEWFDDSEGDYDRRLWLVAR